MNNCCFHGWRITNPFGAVAAHIVTCFFDLLLARLWFSLYFAILSGAGSVAVLTFPLPFSLLSFDVVHKWPRPKTVGV